MNFSQRLKETRLFNGLTQLQLSEKAQISRSVLSQYEHGHAEPTAGVVGRIAGALGVSADYLLGLEDEFGGRTAGGAVIERPAFDITDKQLVDVVKLFGVMSEIQKARVLGYIIAYLESEGVNVGKVLGY